jgi:rhodanese-related sulfurtransferase
MVLEPNTPVIDWTFGMKSPSLLLIALLGLMACTDRKVEGTTYHVLLNSLLQHSVDEVSVQEAQSIPEVLYLDARSWEEYEVSHLPGARFIGDDPQNMEKVSDVDKTRPMVVYCTVGYRSELLAEAMLEAGYTRVGNLYGGIIEWVNQGNLVYDALEKPTQRVHVYNKAWGIWLKKGQKVY